MAAATDGARVPRDARALRALETLKASNGKPLAEFSREVDAKTRD